MAAPSTPTALALTAKVGGLYAVATNPVGQPLDYLEFLLSTDSGFVGGLVTLQATTYNSLTKSAVSFPRLTAGPYWVKVRAHNAAGYSAYTASQTLTLLARTRLDLVEGASAMVPGSATVSLRSDGATPAVISLGYSALTDGATWTSLLTIPTAALGGPGTSFLNPTDVNELALAVDSGGNIFVAGTAADDGSKLLVRRYARVGSTNAWVAGGASSVATPFTLAGTTPTAHAAACFAGSGTTPVESIVVLTRRDGAFGDNRPYELVYNTLNLASIALSSSSAGIANGSRGGNSNTDVRIGVERLGNLRAVFVEGPLNWPFDVTNGVLATPPVSGGATSFGIGVANANTRGKSRTLPLDATRAVTLTSMADGTLQASLWRSIATAGTFPQLDGIATIAAATVQGGAWLNQWDAIYNPANNSVRLYFVPASASNALSYIDISLATSTPVAGSAASLTTGFGAGSSTNLQLRVARVTTDERHVLVEGANLSGATATLVSYSDLLNLAPTAPALVDHLDYDATSASVFSWVFGDPDPADTQRAYQLQIINVATSVVTYDSGKIVSSSLSATVPANSLTNGAAYRWQVRTYDQLDAVSPYSTFDTFSAANLGTLTITSPAADDPANILTSSLNIAWTYTQGNGYTQASRRVRVLDAATPTTVYSDTTMQANTTPNYTVTNLPSGVRVAVEVTLTNSNGQVTSAVVRYLTSTYASPPTPTFTLTQGASFVAVAITNPASSGSQPSTDHNVIYRRAAGTLDAFAIVGIAPANSTYNDHTTASNAAYDYYVASESAGGTLGPAGAQTITAPLLYGVWVHNPNTPDTTDTNFPYAKGHTLTAKAAATMTRPIGRRLGVVTYGEQSIRSIAVVIPLYFGDATHDAGVAYWLAAVEARSTLCYRDGRGRVMFGALIDDIAIADQDTGTQIAVKLDEVDYSVTVS